MLGEFHSRDGFYFTRTADGSVRIRIAESGMANAPTLREVTLPENEWASVVAFVSAHGETGETWQAARKFHAGRSADDVQIGLVH